MLNNIYMWKSSLLALLLSIPAFAYEAKVVSIVDGDTFTIDQGGKVKKIRLYGVDSPESYQDGGEQASSRLSALILNKTVTLEKVDTDRYNREVAIVFAGKQNVSAAMVGSGDAWVYPKYCKKPDCKLWTASQLAAKDSKIGLWADAKPVEPWDFRHSTTSLNQESPSASTQSEETVTKTQESVERVEEPAAVGEQPNSLSDASVETESTTDNSDFKAITAGLNDGQNGDQISHSNEATSGPEYYWNTNSGKVHRKGCPALANCTVNCEKLPRGAEDAKLLIKRNKKSSCGRCHPDRSLGITLNH